MEMEYEAHWRNTKGSEEKKNERPYTIEHLGSASNH
jgi:hypothetical protein